MDRFLFLSLVNHAHMHFSTQCELTLRCCVPCDLQQCVQKKKFSTHLPRERKGKIHRVVNPLFSRPLLRCLGYCRRVRRPGARVVVCLSVCSSVRPSVRCRLVCSPLPRWVLGAPISWICVVWLALRCQPRAPPARVPRRRLSYPG